MGRGSLKASSKGIEAAKKALQRHGFTQKALGEDLNIGRSTISKFFNGKTVERYVFDEICKKLGLNWEEIFEAPPEEEKNNFPEIDALVQNIRQKVREDIQKSCGTMRVLDMTQPIDLGSIYTQVNILEKITGRTRVELNKLLENFNLEEENFYRLGLCGIKEKRVEGLEAVQNNDKLMVLGKPGAGKTTFLKYLAIQCNKGDFLKNHVSIFIPLKQFAETELENQTQPGLFDYISLWLRDRGVIENQSKAEQLLKSGRVFVLLDGLDEVREEDGDSIIKEIRNFSQKFSSSQFVITCRIAAREYTFEQFTEVEVADFGDEQIKQFAECWFKTKKLDDYSKDFIQQLEDNEQIKELATNPLLLTLLCLEFEDSRSFPIDRAELYKRATETLLRKWDEKRRIYRQQVYKQLSVKRKEDLLSQLAFNTFNEKQYFFKRNIVENYIADYIINLPDAPTDTKQLDIDSQAVLKSIEAQHGLLVERARGIYSFSHLTFQEYFTAQKIVSDQELSDLVEHITEKRWREVFLLTAGMLTNADNLLKLMKKKVDRLLPKEKKLEDFLCWVNRKANSVETDYKLVAVQTYYFALGCIEEDTISMPIEISEELKLQKDIISKFGSNFKQSFLFSPFRLTITGNLAKDYLLDKFIPTITRIVYQNITPELNSLLSKILALYLDFDISPELKQVLKNLIIQLPQENSSPELIEEWWLENGDFWKQQLRNTIINYLDIWHNSQFSEEQKRNLQSYLYANQILLECLENKNNYITRSVREEIESSLYLPFEMVENQFPDV